ncbi:MAG TPA: hypothetical protein VN519_06840 [Bryobacteraceae bacterium]|nr:hypothetical protein [Bryobacteraceae bacterium]
MDFHEIEKIECAVEGMKGAFAQIQQPRSDYQIEHFVLGQHHTGPRQYMQCVLELQIKYFNIRRAKLAYEEVLLDIQDMTELDSPRNQIALARKQVDLEEAELGLLGAFREFWTLFRLWQAFPRQYSHAELQAAETAYWHKRLMTQAEHDRAATGRIGVGNLEAIRQAGGQCTLQEDGRMEYAFPVPEVSLIS